MKYYRFHEGELQPINVDQAAVLRQAHITIFGNSMELKTKVNGEEATVLLMPSEVVRVTNK